MAMLYDLGFVCARTQHIHIGHQRIIDMGLMTCDRVLIMLGSSQESRTARNPFTFEERKSLIQKVYEKECKNGRIIIRPLPDMTNDPEKDISPVWGKYVLSHVVAAMDKAPDVMIYGNDEARSRWFDKEDIKDMMEIIIPRTRIEISATKIREFLTNYDEKMWREFTPRQIHGEFENLRNILVQIPEYNWQIPQYEMKEEK